ncbi:GNAT family N-acetyltransferase [Serratia proteamaculans]|jgi:RimJ/RimL family protein N-acetyltransferase|uniref:GNAT family N-acetyltransferase n=1 Tax=Serratia proteamaculans TaxID=28151 RepID=UPI002178EE55|nr:GNAT family protein [Serratia proteamaculans]CAI1954321.1 Putative ribosomal N-acetyltransferase YdaF [Serratia proteamaculans]
MADLSWLMETELKSESISLIPLRKEHASQLVEAASDGRLWELWFTSVPNEDTVADYISLALSEQAAGRALPFVVVHNATQKIIGTTRVCHADGQNRRVEIGYTWYAKSHQKTAVNTECKLLLLSYLFESLAVIAVEFRTHWHNHVSRAAIARLGAKQDGVLRNHQKNADGSYRDTVVFSIIDHEWPMVKKSLSYKLRQARE